MKIYLSGPMSGLPDYNRPAFNRAAALLRAVGYEVFNPAEIDLGPGTTWDQYLRYDLKILLDYHKVATLDGWAKSVGAALEVSVALKLGMTVRPVSHWSCKAVRAA